MRKTPAPRVRAMNLYTVESNGQPVAQAMAISRAEAIEAGRTQDEFLIDPNGAQA